MTADTQTAEPRFTDDPAPPALVVEASAVALKPRGREPIADGVYLDLPMTDYVRDEAISGSKLYLMLTEPGAVQWDGPANPLWEEPDEDKSKPHLLRGSACHTAILEGLDVYGEQYVVPPANLKCLRTGNDMGDWLAGIGLKKSGTVAEQRARIEEARLTLPEEQRPVFFDEYVGDRKLLKENDDAYVRLIAHFVRSDPAVAPFLADGFAEVSVFMTVRVSGKPVRVKFRLDHVNAKYLLDLKSYGRPPRLDRSLRRHLVQEAWWNGYHLQAVHNSNGWRIACGLYLQNRLQVRMNARDGDADERHARFSALMKAHGELYAAESAPEWAWLFVRMAGAPTSIIIPFDREDRVWSETEEQIGNAMAHYVHLRETCGADKLWFASAGVQTIEELDWPIQALGGRL